MKTLLAAATAVSLLAIAAPASADVYGSLGYSQSQYDAPVDADFDEITGRLGWGGEDKWYGAEAELSLGLGEERVAGVDYALTSDLSVFAVAHFNLAESFTVFGRVGYGVTRFEIKPGLDVSGDGPVYGVGAQVNIGEADGLRLDYTFHDLDTDFGESPSKWTISWVRRFR
jgi:hypothetical protein